MGTFVNINKILIRIYDTLFYGREQKKIKIFCAH